MAQHILTQIYEIQSPAEAATMIESGVDHIGSVIVSPSNWKQPVIKETVDRVQQTRAKSSLILLFQDNGLVFSSLEYYRPDIVHFCEMLVDPNARQPMADAVRICMELQASIRERFPEIKIMRSIPIPESGKAEGFSVMSLATLFEPISDYFLTDTLIIDDEGNGANQPVSGFVGITGKTCDWGVAAQLVKESRIPVILAGGMSPDNVFDGITTVRPAGVDSCTLTNAVDKQGRPIRFQKDMVRVDKFVAETRRAEDKLRADFLT